MLSKLVAVSLIFSVVKAVFPPPPSANNYTTISARHSVKTELQDGPFFYMRDKQCTGSIQQSYLCGNFEPLGLSVTVSDSVAYPLVHIEESLTHVSVARRPNANGNCVGDINVDMQLLCEGFQISPAQPRLPLPSRPE